MVEDALCSVGRMFALLGFRDPRLQPSGSLDLRLSHQLKAYKRIDPPPCHVKPIALPIITHAAQLCRLANTPHVNTIADMLILGFYFLLHPGEYARTDNKNSTPFRLCNTHLICGAIRLHPFTSTKQDLRSATHVALKFTNQKNGVRRELIGLGRSGDQQWCPIIAVIHQVLYLRLHRANPTMPLYSYFDRGQCAHIQSTHLTFHLHATAHVMGAVSGITANDMSVHSLRLWGAMALTCAGVDPDKIYLLGH